MRLELRDGTSNKFWEIRLEAASFTTRWGRIGSEGQSTTKSFDTPELAKKEHDKLVAKKQKEGYAASEGPASSGASSLRYELGDFDANDAWDFVVAPPDASGLRFTASSEALGRFEVHVSEAALESGVGPLRIVQGALYAADAEISGGEVTTHTAPFLVPRRFIRELRDEGTSTLQLEADDETFTRGELDGDDEALAKRCGLPLLRAEGSGSHLLVSADPGVPMLLARVVDVPMVAWTSGSLGWKPTKVEEAAKATKPAKAAKPAKIEATGSKDDAVIAALRSDPAVKQRIAAAKKLAKTTNVAAARALLDAAWLDASREVQVAAANTHPEHATKQAAIVALLEELLAAPGDLGSIWEGQMRDQELHFGGGTCRQNRLHLAMEVEPAQLSADARAKLEAIACGPGPEAAALRSTLVTNWRTPALLSRALEDLGSPDPAAAEIARSALYALFREDPKAARAAAERLLGDLSSDAQRAHAVHLVSGFSPPVGPAWIATVLPIFSAVPEARAPIARELGQRLYRRGPVDRDAMLAEVGGRGASRWQEVLVAMARLDSRIVYDLDEHDVPDAALTGEVLTQWILLDALGGEHALTPRVLAAFERADARAALASGHAVLSEVLATDPSYGPLEGLWKYVSARGDLPALARAVLAAYEALPEESRDAATLEAMRGAAG